MTIAGHSMVNVFNVFHWVIFFIGIAAAAALVWLFILHSKYRSLVILLAAQSHAAAQIIRTPMPKLLSLEGLRYRHPMRYK